MITGNLCPGARGLMKPMPHCTDGPPFYTKRDTRFICARGATDETLDFHTWHLLHKFHPGKTIQQSIQNILSHWAMEFFGAVPSLRITDIIYLTLKKFLIKYCAVYFKRWVGNPHELCRIILVSLLERELM